MKWPIILVTGSGDEATAVAVRLFRSGFKVILIVHNKPVDLHYHRNFTRCIFQELVKLRVFPLLLLAWLYNRMPFQLP